MKTLLFLFFFISTLQAQGQPNILWIVCEDISPTLSMYGDSTAQTPHLDALAAESVIFNNAFATVGVCAPSRSAIITGMYPTSIGTMHMRTGKDITSWGKREYKSNVPIIDIQGDTIRQYAAVLPEKVKCFTEYLRADGYFCTNNEKTDYQFAAPITAWDENNNKAHWRNRPKGKPFFSVFNFNVTHESKLWKNAHLPLTVDPNEVPVPPYLPDTETSRLDIARHYSNVELLDGQIAKLIQQLKDDGLYDETIIFFYSDHGGPLPRQKREIYDSGLHIPLFIKSISSQIKGRTDRLISCVDLAPTVLSLAGIVAPPHIDGQAFMGKYKKVEAREYIFGSSDRFDEYTDRSRMIRDSQFLYIRNFFPDKTKYKDLAYRKKVPMMLDMLNLYKNNQLNTTQAIWFGDKETEELYDCITDPHNLINLATEIDYQQDLQRMQRFLLEQLSQSPDWGQIPEAQLIDMMWPNGQQPVTVSPLISKEEELILLNCPTKGASIAYYWAESTDDAFNLNASWQLYHTSIPIQKGMTLYVVAERIGFKISSVTKMLY